MKVTGRLLTASVEDRMLSYLLLPYNEQGRTNVGRVTASAGSVTVPEDVSEVRLNVEHDDKRPVGRAVAIEETAEGLTATFAVARTRAGDDLLEEAREGLRAAVSVEVDNPVIRAGRLIKGLLTGAGAVVSPAFPSAQLVAADAGDLEDEDEEAATDGGTEGETPVSPDETAPGDAEGETEGETPDEKEKEQSMSAAFKAATAPVGTLTAGKMKAEDGPTTGELFKKLAAAAATMSASKLTAALDEVTAADVFNVTNQPQYVGELWSGKSYIEKFAPLVGHANLTGPKVTGWRFVDGKAPTVASYAGFPNQPTSNEVDTEAIEATVSRLAGGWAVDRIHRDFPSEEFWRAFFAAATEDYAKKRDAAVLAHLVANATATTADAQEYNAPTAAAKIVDGALAMMDYATPTFAIVGSDLWKELLLIRREGTLEYLSMALGFDDGTLNGFKIIPSASASLTGKVLVGSREAVTLHELPGVPVRIDTESISTGGVETGLFGYYSLLTHNAKGLRLVADA